MAIFVAFWGPTDFLFGLPINLIVNEGNIYIIHIKHVS